MHQWAVVEPRPVVRLRVVHTFGASWAASQGWVGRTATGWVHTCDGLRWGFVLASQAWWFWSWVVDCTLMYNCIIFSFIYSVFIASRSASRIRRWDQSGGSLAPRSHFSIIRTLRLGIRTAHWVWVNECWARKSTRDCAKGLRFIGNNGTLTEGKSQ